MPGRWPVARATRRACTCAAVTGGARRRPPLANENRRHHVRIAGIGIKGSQAAERPPTEEACLDHLERMYHRPVRRDVEPDDQCLARFLAAYPEARNCQDCREAGAPWVEPQASQRPLYSWRKERRRTGQTAPAV
jgi:hypothetical protein